MYRFHYSGVMIDYTKPLITAHEQYQSHVGFLIPREYISSQPVPIDDDISMHKVPRIQVYVRLE